jgi:hypothetical protein
MKNTSYIISLILISVSIFLLIEYPNSNRMSLFAGIFTAIGFALNIVGFILSNEKHINKI